MKYIKYIAIIWLMSVFSICYLNGQDTKEITFESFVYDQQGNPIIDAVITGNEGDIVTSTDLKGRFTINVPLNSTVMITATDFLPTLIKAQMGVPQIVLERDTIGKPIQVAYKKVSSKELGANISVFDAKDFIDKDYNSNVVSEINGKVGGLLWSNNIWGLQNALILVDGVPRNYSDVRMEEVDHITFLKGANAVALYGSMAAKGVVLITTKRGEAYHKKINIRATSGIGTPKIFPKYLNSAEYMTLYNEARVNDGLNPLYDAEIINKYKSGNPYRYPDIDYYSSNYIKNYITNNDVTAEFSGGNKQAQFYSNIGWTQNTSLLNFGEGKNENFNRFNVRGNVDVKLNDFISSSVDVSAIINNNRYAMVDYWSAAANQLPNKYSPLVPVELIHPDSIQALQLANNSKNIIDGKYILGGTQEFMTNPIANVYVGGHSNNIQRLLQITNGIDVNLNSILEGLTFHTKLNMDYSNSYNQVVQNNYAVYTPTWDSINDVIVGLVKWGTDERSGRQDLSNASQVRTFGFSSQFNFDRTFQSVHNLSAMLIGAVFSRSTSGVLQNWTNSNIGLQLSYNYDHKYGIDFSSAIVNSTKLPSSKRIGFSPTIGLSWVISQESFLQNSSTIDYLKLYASAGIINTDLDISDYYLYENVYSSTGGYGWNDGTYSNSASVSNYGANPNLTYVKRKEISLGLTGLFFKKLVKFESNLFVTTIDGLPTQRFSIYPSYMRSFVPYENYNANRYYGADALVSIDKKFGEIAMNVGISATYVKSKVVKRDELYVDAYQRREGQPVDAIFGLVSDGFFMDQNEINNHPRQIFGDVRPGDIKYVDQNGDNIIDERDEVKIGQWISPLTGGLHLTLGYKKLSLFMLGVFQQGGYGMKSSNYYWVDGDDKYSEVVKNRWTEATKNTATFPRLSSQQNTNNYRYSDFWIYKTDLFRLDKIQLNYEIQSESLRSLYIKRLAFYLMGSNLLTLSPNKDIMDLNIGSSPQFRYYALGVKFNF